MATGSRMKHAYTDGVHQPLQACGAVTHQPSQAYDAVAHQPLQAYDAVAHQPLQARDEKDALAFAGYVAHVPYVFVCCFLMLVFVFSKSI